MADKLELEECGAGCGWLFVKGGAGAYCNDCGHVQSQPRICRADGRSTDWRTLVVLARYVAQASATLKGITLGDAIAQNMLNALDG